ncbi:MAG: hypothetical protein K2X93_07835 [Candidatus Obscuribacterales bacterium]|nr:hypothetical protein [Candidatus Obscuribacterales bacterium]
MKSTRRRGATLGLVAVVVLVIIILGIGFYILSQVLGGGREVANATDAGVLTVARKALSPTLINISLTGDTAGNPTDDFIGCDPNNTGTTDNTHRKISMLTVNRMIAQACLVACNAQEISTTEASTNALSVATAARASAQALKNAVNSSLDPTGPGLGQEFNNVAGSNNTKMFEGNPVTVAVGGLTSAFLRPGLSTNVYLTPNLVSAVQVSIPSSLLSITHHPNALNHDSGGTENYIAGYINFAIPAGPGTTVNLSGVPVFPRQKPHLVDIGEFVTSANPPFTGGDYLPPNAFRAGTSTQVANSGAFGGAVACALVGALDQDFVASIPRGYLRIKNGPDAIINNPNVVTNGVVDANTDVFNNELWPPSGAGVSNNNLYALGTGQNNLVRQWAAYNELDGMDGNMDYVLGSGNTITKFGYTYDFSSGPPVGPNTPGFKQTTTSLTEVADIGAINSTGFGCHNVTQADVRAISDVGTGSGNCNLYTVWGAGCGGVSSNQSRLARAIAMDTGASVASGAMNSTGFTAVEVQKADLLYGRQAGTECSDPVDPAGKSGMKRFSTGACIPYIPGNSSYPVNFGQPDSPLAYINQIGDPNVANSCASNLVDKIHHRMRQVDPRISRAQIMTALGTPSLPLGLGKTLLLYVPNPTSPSPGVAMIDGDATGPADYFNLTMPNDGRTSTVISHCENTYHLEDTIVNSKKSNGCPIGDAGFHEAPFTQGPIEGNPLMAADRVFFKPASGFRNLLGDVEFENEANGSGTFCKPN